MPRVKAGVAELEADVLADVEAAAASNKEGLIPPLPPSLRRLRAPFILLSRRFATPRRAGAVLPVARRRAVTMRRS